MKKPILLLAATVISSACFAQQNTSIVKNNPFIKWLWLVGEWQGEGDGQTGKGSGTFTFLPDLDKKILVRKSHSEYPATKDKTKIVHDDLMIVYLDSPDSSKAIYFDNEGHVINYTIVLTPTTITMTSELIPNVPTFRLTYNLLSSKTITVKFEISQDSEDFTTYTEGKCVRIK